jgi:hypothetical protein
MKNNTYQFRHNVFYGTSFWVNVNKLLNWYDLNIYIINIIADDEIKIGMHLIPFYVIKAFLTWRKNELRKKTFSMWNNRWHVVRSSYI